jgi:hypothetical protein
MKNLLTILTLVFGLFAFSEISHAKAAGGEYTVQECTYDFAVKGGAVGFIDLCGAKSIPAGSYVVDGFYIVQTAFTSGGSATVALGDSNSNARYLAATAYNNAAYTSGTIAKFAIGTPLNVDAAAKGKLGVTVATAALTAGKVKLVVVVYTPKG